MADDYASLTQEEYSQLSIDDYAQMSLDSTSEESGGSTSTSCPWSSATVTSLIQAIADLTEKVDDLSEELAKVTARIPSSGTGTLVTTDDVSTFANAVWTSNVTNVGRTLTDAVSVDTSGIASSLLNTDLSTYTTANTVGAKINAIDTKSDIATSVWSYSTGGTAARTLTQSVDTSTLATADSVAKVHALLGNWSVSGTTLTSTYGTNQTETFTLTKDSDNNITGVAPTGT